MARRVASSAFVGRSLELSELEAALTEAAAGRASLAFVAGDSGVGKTRLLRELERRAHDNGARVIGGDAVELGEGELPYAPIVAALRPLARGGDPALDDLPDAARSELATLLPALGTVEPIDSDEERGSAQRRLFEALLALLDRLGQDAPVLFSLEDVHWADGSTRAFIAFLAASLSTEPVLVVATYRTDEMHRRQELRALLAELERDARTRRIELAPLERTELAVLVEDITGSPPDEAAVDRLFGRSEGNPLFAEELLAADPGGVGALPPTLRDALMVRVELLPAASVELLRLLAAAGRADHALLADASGLDGRELTEALREAVAGHIVVVDGEGRYGFRHALLREVVHDDLLPGERDELHLALARALERRDAEAGRGPWTTAAVAHHYRAGGDRPAELRASVRAAGEAGLVHAHGEAAALLERALELSEGLSDATQEAGVDHVELLLRTARAQWAQGDDSRAVTLFERALEELDREGDGPLEVAGVHGELAAALWGLGRGEESRVTLDRALSLLPDDGPTDERAKLLAERLRVLMLSGRYRETIDAAPEAITAADAAGAEAVRGRILNRLGTALFAVGEDEEGAARLHEAMELARRRGTADDLARAWENLADALNRAGRGREAHDAVRAAADEISVGGRSERWLRLTRSEIAFDIGDWDDAGAQLGGRRPRETGSTGVNARLREAELALGRGDEQTARTLLGECAEALAGSLETQLVGSMAGLRAELERRAGDLDAARAAVDHGLESCRDDPHRLLPVATVGTSVEADAAQRARDLGDEESERTATARLEGLLHSLRVAEREHPVGYAYLASTEAESSRGRGRPDPDLWLSAAQAWERVGRPYPHAIALWRRAEALTAAGERDAATEAANRALGIARELGSAWLAGELEGLAARGRLRVEEAAPAANGDGGGEDGDPFGLTERERQVLALLARGATNREIGAELYMAEKTASVHVSRILAKLGVRRRTEAAAVAHRHGLGPG